MIAVSKPNIRKHYVWFFFFFFVVPTWEPVKIQHLYQKENKDVVRIPTPIYKRFYSVSQHSSFQAWLSAQKNGHGPYLIGNSSYHSTENQYRLTAMAIWNSGLKKNDLKLLSNVQMLVKRNLQSFEHSVCFILIFIHFQAACKQLHHYFIWSVIIV